MPPLKFRKVNRDQYYCNEIKPGDVIKTNDGFIIVGDINLSLGTCGCCRYEFRTTEIEVASLLDATGE
jgi:predicted phosphatase